MFVQEKEIRCARRLERAEMRIARKKVRLEHKENRNTYQNMQTNCVNCGAPINRENVSPFTLSSNIKCEYCGTYTIEKPKPIQNNLARKPELKMSLGMCLAVACVGVLVPMTMIKLIKR